MALTKFVNNVEDLSDDGGFKFRFKCDRCHDGFESQYIASKSNVLKTAIEMFQIFDPIAGRIGNTAASVGRGLQGKERDAAYERAVGEAQAFFKKCSACGHWVCPDNCWNDKRGLCDVCAPESGAAAAKEANRLEVDAAIQSAISGKAETAVINCPVCGNRSGGGKFCQTCGTSIAAKPLCKSCSAPLEIGAKFCGNCGGKS